MTWLLERRFPVPAVHSAAGRDLVMDRVSGPTMLDDLDRRPWMVVAHIRTLAKLQKTLNGLTAPEWLPPDRRIPEGSSVLHVDLHPMNVIMSPQGPVVIDWTNAKRGHGDFDAAMSYLLMAAYEARGVKESASQQVVTRLFRRLRGRGSVRRGLLEAGRFRLEDPNVTDGERLAISKLVGDS